MGEENVEEQMEVGVSGGWKQTLGGGMDGWWWCTHGNSVYGRGGPGSRGVWGKPVGRGSRCARGVAVGRRSKPVEKKEGGGQGPYGVANRACSVRSPHISKRAQGGGTGGGKGGYRLWKTALLFVSGGSCAVRDLGAFRGRRSSAQSAARWSVGFARVYDALARRRSPFGGTVTRTRARVQGSS